MDIFNYNKFNYYNLKTKKNNDIISHAFANKNYLVKNHL